ncbi:NlpC/P60 family protein [Caldisericum exile]|uniref:C40 family peptidase n=5 Tax=Caldisericum TaxID=693074 RepID=UPI003C75AA54
MLKKYVINVPFTSMYGTPEVGEVISQVIMGEIIDVLSFSSGFAKIVAEDGYTGYVEESVLREFEVEERPIAITKEPFSNAYSGPTVKSKLIFTLSIGSVLLDKGKEDGDYRLVSDFYGREFYLHKNTLILATYPFQYERRGCKDILKTALQFLNIPYFWGGKTTFGFDCSGFVQTVFKLNGFKLLRDAHMQANMDIFKKFYLGDSELLPCDVIFFGKVKIDHVGIYLGHNRFIHATTFNVPKVQISEFNYYWKEKTNIIGRLDVARLS